MGITAGERLPQAADGTGTGAVGYVAKPFDLNTLLAAVRAHGRARAA